MIASSRINIPQYNIKIGDKGIIKQWYGNVAEIQFKEVLLAVHRHQIQIVNK